MRESIQSREIIKKLSEIKFFFINRYIRIYVILVNQSVFWFH